MAILERIEGGVLELQRHEREPLLGRPRAHRAGRRVADLRQKRERTAVGELPSEVRCAGVVDTRERRVEAHDGARLETLEQREKRARFRLRRRLRSRAQRDVSRVVLAALVDDRIGTPVRGRKVAVQIDASGVAARSAQHPVRVAAKNHRGAQIAAREASERFRHDDGRLRFVPVNRGEDDDLRAPSVGEVGGERDSLERGAVAQAGVTDRSPLAPLHQPLLCFVIHPTSPRSRIIPVEPRRKAAARPGVAHFVNRIAGQKWMSSHLCWRPETVSFQAGSG